MTQEQEEKLEHKKELQKIKDIIENFDYSKGSPSLAGFLSEKFVVPSVPSKNGKKLGQ